MSNLYLTPEEDQYFRQLWSIIDPQGFGSANARDTVAFFKKSQLPADKLKNIWLMSVTNQENKLYQQEFNMIMKLIAYSQNGFELSPQLLVDNHPVRLPFVDGMPPPTQSQPQQPQIQQKVNPLAQTYQTVPVQSQQQQQISQVYKPPLVQQTQQDSVSIYEIGKDLIDKYSLHYQQQDKNNSGFIDGETAKNIFKKSELSPQVLTELWALVDIGHKGFLYKFEYIVAIHLISLCRRNVPLPQVLPECMAKIIMQNQPQQSLIITEIKPEERKQSQQDRTLIVPPNQLNNEIQQLSQQQQQLQGQLFQLVMQFQNHSNTNQLKQVVQQKQQDIDYYSQQVSKLQLIFDSLKSQELELNTEIQRLKSKQPSQLTQQSQMNMPLQTQQFQQQQPLYTQQKQVNNNQGNAYLNQNIGTNFPPLSADSHTQQQVDYLLDDGYSNYPNKANGIPQVEYQPW